MFYKPLLLFLKSLLVACPIHTNPPSSGLWTGGILFDENIYKRTQLYLYTSSPASWKVMNWLQWNSMEGSGGKMTYPEASGLLPAPQSGHATSCSKANRQLAFLRRNLQIQNTKVQETAYKGLARPITEYCCTVWDPNYKKYKNQLQSVQRRAAHIVHNRYERQAPVTEMVNNLGWDPLELRRLQAHLTMLLKIQQNLVAVPMPSVISVPVRSTPHPSTCTHPRTPKSTASSFRRSISGISSCPLSRPWPAYLPLRLPWTPTLLKEHYHAFNI